MNPRIVLSALFVLVLTLPVTLFAATEQSTTERSFPTRDTVTVDASFHEIQLTARPGTTIDVTVFLEFTASESKVAKLLTEYQPRFEDSGDRLLIRSTSESSGWGWGSGKKTGKITLAVPPGVDVILDTSSGSISIDGDFGDATIAVDNSSGSVSGKAALSALSIDNSSGSTRFQALRPLDSFAVDCSSGSVRLEGGARRASVDASSGSVHLFDLLGAADVDTSSGSVEMTWAAIPAGTKVEVGASSGSVRLTFPPGTELTGSVQTSSGGIQTDFPGTMNERHTNLELDNGSNAVSLSVSTSSGGVRLISG